MCQVSDNRKVQEPTIGKGDKVIIYGRGNGIATLTQE